MSEDEIFLTHILKCRPVDLLLTKPTLTPKQQEIFDLYKHRRAQHEPLQYILGSWDFMGLELKVTPDVLIPRPETEQLVERVLELIKPLKAPRILDIGTGSGNIPIALARFNPHARIVSIDVSQKALTVAKENALKHSLVGQINFVLQDIRGLATASGASDFLKKYFPEANGSGVDVVVSNPPYIPTGNIPLLPKDVLLEPVLALDGGADGLDIYRGIIKLTPSLLSKGGYLMMEIGEDQAGGVTALAQAFGNFVTVDVQHDLTHRPRFIILRT